MLAVRVAGPAQKERKWAAGLVLDWAACAGLGWVFGVGLETGFGFSFSISIPFQTQLFEFKLKFEFKPYALI